MTDSTTANEKDASSVIHPRKVITPPNTTPGSFTSRYAKTDTSSQVTSDTIGQASAAQPDSVALTTTNTATNPTPSTRSNSGPSLHPRPAIDKVGEDLKKLLLALSKHTTVNENGLAFMPLTGTLQDIQSCKESHALSIAIFMLEPEMIRTMANVPWLGTHLDKSASGTLWECTESSLQQSYERGPLWLRPNAVQSLSLPAGTLAGQRVLLISPHVVLNAVLLGYIQQFSDVLIVLGHEQGFSALKTAIPPALIALSQLAK